MSEPWLDACALDDLPPDGGLLVTIEGKPLAVFRIDAAPGADAGEPPTVRVIDNTCPHAGASLSAGYVDRATRDEGGSTGCVICPSHAWAFDLDTGRSPDNRRFGVRTYPARVLDGRVQVQLVPNPPPKPVADW